MTSTPVMDVGFVPGGMMTAGAKSISNSGFQEVWNNRAKREENQFAGEEGKGAVRNAPGDSLKARDEHRARTEKREPSRNVEERADIPEEKLEEAAEVLGTVAAEVIQQTADILEVDTDEVMGALEELGMEQLDVLNPQKLGELILKVAGAEDSSVMVTDESLYESYRELMAQLETVLQESAETLEQPPEQMPRLLEQLGGVEASEPEIVVEMDDKTVKPENMFRTAEITNEDVPETSVALAQGEETDTEAVNAKTSPEPQSDGRESHREGGREQDLNLFTQNLKTEQFDVQIQPSAAPENPWSSDTVNIMRQIMDYMRINLKPEMSSMEMQLHPASLGTLQVQVASRGGVVTANFITQNEAVKTALESQMIQLKTQFEEQGVKVDAIEVTVQTHEFERNLDQGRGSGSGSREQEPSRRGRIRRLNLNDSVISGETEEEDILAKNLMEINGNTVDYSV